MNLIDRFLVRATIAEIEAITPRMRRIRVTGYALQGLPWLPGQHVRVRVDEVRLRSYTIWDFEDGEHLDLCVLDRPAAGPGARWSRHAHPGQPIAFTRPTGKLVPHESAPYHVFVGDETAAVAFGAILRLVSMARSNLGEARTDVPLSVHRPISQNRRVSPRDPASASS